MNRKACFLSYETKTTIDENVIKHIPLINLWLFEHKLFLSCSFELVLLEVTLESKSLATSLKGTRDFSRNIHVIQVSNTEGLYLGVTLGKK